MAINKSKTVDPYSSDLHLVGVHNRQKRATKGSAECRSKGLGFYCKLEAPGIDWRMILGNKDVGASFGVILENYFHIKVGKLICFTII